MKEDTLDPGLSRRGFLELLGFSLAAAGCERSPVREAIPFVVASEQAMPGEALWYATTCAACPAACALWVKTRDGRPIKVEGHPDSELTRGGTCAVGQASVLGLYDQARLSGPLWHGEPASWSDVDDQVSKRLRAVAAAGHEIALVTGSHTGPAGRRLIAEWNDHFPRSRHVSYDPVSAAAIRRANGAAYGEPVVPHYRFDRARVVVGLDADFLGTWLSPVEFIRGYADGRRLDHRSAHGERRLVWHAQFESRLSLTGAKADLRVGVNASDLGSLALALYDALALRAGWPAIFEDAPATAWRLEDTADKLWRGRRSALVVSGSNDPDLQLVVAAINDLLGNVGHTVDLDRPSAQRQGDERALAELVDDMRQGRIHALVLWGVNPAYDTPLGDAFLDALEQVPLSVSMADRLDETAVRVHAVCPAPHPLESWNDAEPVAGSRSLAQPTLESLFDTRAAQTSLLRWIGREEDWHTYLRDVWRREVFPTQTRLADFERFWERCVHDGVVPAGDAVPPATRRFVAELEPAAAALRRSAAAAAEARRQGRFDLVLYEKNGLGDGRQANNPWLQELPDPISRVAWGNYAALAPKKADQLGLNDGDVVRLEAGGRAIELPVLRQVGQAPETVAVALGYGRRRAGKAADGVGTDAYPLVGLAGGLFRYSVAGVTLFPAGRREELALVQRHGSQEGRPIVKETTLASWRENPASGNEDRPEPLSLWPRRGATHHRWGMTIDLDACVGCSACVVACQAENNVPVVGPEETARGRGMHWIRVDRYYAGSAETPDVVFQPMMCQHCADAPCESVCPVLATVHSSDGLNQQVYNRCIGTRYCANNCPYKVRRFNWFNYARNTRFDYHMNDELGTLVLNPDVVVRSRGVMEKCSMCIQRIQAGKLRAALEERPLADGDIATACQQACPAEAITFGDLDDGVSRVARQAEDPRFYHVLEELNTRPNVGYLTLVRNREASLEPSEEKA